MDAATTRHQQTPPAFFGLAGHPVRWRLLNELARSDRTVSELVGYSGQRQSLVSYHLRRLRDAGVVSMRRSSADHRDTYYRLDLPGCAEALGASGSALHPGLHLVPASEPLNTAPPRRARVLFLCTGNSARSQMAEAFARRAGAGVFDASSAGSHPRAVRPEVLDALRQYGIEWRGRPKHLDAYLTEPFDYVVTLCDRVREVCPDFPGPAERIHWNVPDPADAGDSEAFEQTAAEVETRIRFFLARVWADLNTPRTQEGTDARHR